MTTTTAPPPQAVTVAVTRRALPGRVREVRAWLEAGLALAEESPGFLGAGWVQPSAGSDEWHALYRFSGPASLAAWEASPERAWWLAAAGGLVVDTRVERRSGIEGWFDEPADLTVAVPAAPVVPPPPRWKQAVLIWCGFFPLNLLLSALLTPVLGGRPLPVRVLVTSLCLTPVMVYVVLPQLTRRLEWWLHGRPAPWRTGPTARPST